MATPQLDLACDRLIDLSEGHLLRARARAHAHTHTHTHTQKLKVSGQNDNNTWKV